MSVFKNYIIYCIKKCKSIQRALELFKKKYPKRPPPKLKAVLQIYYRQIYFETKTAQEAERKRDKLIAICFDESNGTYGDIIEKLTVLFRLNKFIIINSLLRSRRLENVDMNTTHEAIFNISRAEPSDSNSEGNESSEDEIDKIPIAELNSSKVKKKTGPFSNGPVLYNYLDANRVPIVYTTRLEHMSPLPELSVRKFCKAVEIKSKPTFKGTVKRKTRMKIDKLTENIYIKDTEIIHTKVTVNNNKQTINSVSNNVICNGNNVVIDDDDGVDVKHETLDVEFMDVSEEITDSPPDSHHNELIVSSLAYRIHQEHNDLIKAVRNRILDRNIVVVFHNITKRIAESYRINDNSEIIEYYKVMLDKNEQLQEVLHRECNIDHAEALFVKICCWFSRKSIVKTLWPMVDGDTLKFLKPIHHCTFGKCDCCCRKNISDLSISAQIDTPKCLLNDGGKDCAANYLDSMSPLIQKAMHYNGNKYNDRPATLESGRPPCEITHIVIHVINNNREGVNMLPLKKKMYEVNTQGDIISEHIINTQSDNIISSSPSVLTIINCCLHMHKEHVKKLSDLNVSMQSINYLIRNGGGEHLPIICVKCEEEHKAKELKQIREITLNMMRFLPLTLEHSRKGLKHLTKDKRHVHEDEFYVPRKIPQKVYIDDNSQDSNKTVTQESADLTLCKSEKEPCEVNITCESEVITSDKSDNEDVFSDIAEVGDGNDGESTQYESSSIVPNVTTADEQSLLRDTLMTSSPTMVPNDNDAPILRSIPPVQDNEKLITIRLKTLPKLLNNMIVELNKFVVANQITETKLNMLLDSLNEIQLRMKPDGSLSALFSSTLPPFSDIEIRIIQKILQKIQLYVKNSNLFEALKCPKAVPQTTSKPPKKLKAQPSKSSAIKKPKMFDKYSNFEQWLHKDCFDYTNDFQYYKQQFDFQKDDNTLPKISNVFSLNETNTSQSDSFTQTDNVGKFDKGKNNSKPLDLEEEISYSWIFRPSLSDSENNSSKVQNNKITNENEDDVDENRDSENNSIETYTKKKGVERKSVDSNS
ncbi:uncharacterized protein LOC123702028 isoform X2 [Colias croceus]|uniref:uncharacterized protein LOC123702028 isoform X2 n=1 Tax=Colias crocea TaxID=72248 RepID=UPI001E27B937|nr:uncharacterized protein LOC123702028 isoform X2 [Colias croceus]